MAKKNMKYRGLSPIAMMLLGSAVAAALLVCLFLFDFRLVQLAWYLPGLALAAVLIFFGRGKAAAGKK